MSFKPFALILLALLCSNSYADLVVNRSIVTYSDPKQMKEDLVVFNSAGNSNLYVQIDAYEVINPGESNQDLAKIDLANDPEFMVSPNKLIVSPGDRNIVRLLNLESQGAAERVYRINLIPVTPPVELLQSGEEELESKLEVVVAYQVLTIVLPENPAPKLKQERNGQSAEFSNIGNANYLLTEGEQCNPEDPSECQVLESHRVYPGNIWSLNLPFDGPFTYKVKTHNGLVSRQFN